MMGEPYVKKDVPFDQGPVVAGKQLWDNVTNGQGPMGLISQDGTVGGAANEAAGALLSPVGARGGSPAVGAFGPLPDGASPTAGADVPPAAGFPAEMSQVDNTVNGLMLSQELHNGLVSDGTGPTQPSAFYRPQGGDYSSIGGPEGQENFNETFKQGPRKLADAQQALADEESKKSAALGQFYDQQSAKDAQMAAQIAANRKHDQANLAVRQEKLDKATQFYSDDLADQGKFWTNPGNIMAAISFSLLPIFSNDPAVGVKLINQAVQQDMANRQTAASGTLGALQSNLAGYHKIAGDREAGDLLAQSEAHRMAANEAMRIGQKFESPISQAKLKVIVQDQMNKADALKMEAYRSWVYQPAQKMDPGLHAARGKGYDGSWEAFGKKDVAPIGSQVRGTISGTPTTAGERFTDHVTPATQAVIRVGGSNAAFKAALEGRVPGSGNLFVALKQSIAQEANTKAQGDPHKAAVERQRIVEAAESQIKEAPELTKLAGQRAGIASLQKNIAAISAAEASVGKDPREFLGTARNFMPTDWVQKYESLAKAVSARGAPGSAAELAQMQAQARRQFRQQLSAQINAYTLENAGSAVSEGDAQRVGRVINPDMPLDDVSNWINMQSEKQSATETAALARLPPVAGLMMMVRTGIGVPTKVPTRGRAAPIPAGLNPLPKGVEDATYGMSGKNASAKPKLSSGGD